MSKNDGGAAFPRDFVRQSEGMSLRDYFAAKAMQGFNANPYFDSYAHANVAQIAYEQADAMIAAREVSK